MANEATQDTIEYAWIGASTTNHILNPERPGRVWCGRQIVSTEFIVENGPIGPVCQRCKAKKG